MRVPPASRSVPSPRFWAVAGLALALDWATKWAAHTFLVPGRPVPVLGSLARLTLSYDSRTSLWLGIPGTPHWQQPTGLAGVTLARVLILGAVLWLASRAPRRSWGYPASLALVLAAGLGNSVEHLVRGANVNLLDLGVGAHRWPTFNLADAFVLTGSALFVWLARREFVAEVRARGLRSLREIPMFSLPPSFRRHARPPAAGGARRTSA